MYKIRVAENRGKNRNGYELVILKRGEVWTKKITKRDVKNLENLGIEINEG